MKKKIAAFLACFSTAIAVAQNLRLNDSVIFINNNPVALYAIDNSKPHYNMEVYSFNDYVLIKAEVIKFNNPVPELASFYYYELTFPPTNDTLSIYNEEGSFSVALGKMIGEYDLINKNELNKKNLARLIREYPGRAALLAKINAFTTHLDFTRDFSLQIVRDRSKAVFIDESGVIMQDNVQIGKAKEVTRFLLTDRPIGSDPFYHKPVWDIPYKVKADPIVNTVKNTEIYFVNGSIVDERKIFLVLKTSKSKELKTGNDLYEISKPKQKSKDVSVLKHVCFLIENMML